MSAAAPRRAGSDFIARHGETVFNAAGRMQGAATVHTPLTRAGFAQADAMGTALRALLGPRPALTLWASPTGRALQTLAVICEHLELDWHAVHTDPRLVEIDVGSWSGRTYQEVIAEHGPVIDAHGRLVPAPDGEDYATVAARVGAWASDTAADPGDRLVVMHGISALVLRGVLAGLPPDPVLGAPVAARLPQGSVSLIDGGRDMVVHLAAGRGPA